MTLDELQKCREQLAAATPKPTGEWTNVDVEELWEKGGSIAVKDAINAALAAEREKVQTLVDALKKTSPIIRSHGFFITADKLDAALAKVK